MPSKIYEISDAYIKQRELLSLPRTLMGGTVAMREAGEKYLPKKSAEVNSDYETRLAGSVLVNFFARTVDYLAGQVFQKPVDYQEPPEGVAPKYNKEFFENIFREDVDLAGNNLSMFALQLFRNGIIDGVSFVMVEYPKLNLKYDENGPTIVQGDGKERPWTKALEQELNVRPYLIQIRAEQVLDAWVQVVNGKPVLSLFVYEEYIEQPAEDNVSDRATIQRIRVLRPGVWEVWEVKNTIDKTGRAKQEIEKVDSGSTSLNYIPVFWFMPGNRREEAITADPPLADLAEMNRAYYVAYSNYRELMKWNSSPIWFATNVVGLQGESLAIGPSCLVNVKTQGDAIAPSLTSVGINPESVTKAQEDLRDMKTYMESYGLQVALAPVGNVTATQIAAAMSSSDSQLKGMCVKLADTLENVLLAVSQYEAGSQDAEGPAVSVNMTFRQSFDSNLASLLKGLADSDKLTTLTLLRQLKQMGLFSDEFDPDEEADILDKMKEESMPSLQAMFGNTSITEE